MSLVPARRPGWLLEGRGNSSPRGMAAQSRFASGDGQNPAYRPSGIFRLYRGARSQSAGRARSLEWQWMHGQAEEIGRLGISALALLRRQGPRGRARCACATARAATRPATGPRPRRRNSPERWYFCEAHAAEYNKNWNYFAGLSPEEAARARGRGGARRVGLPPVGAVEMGRARRRQPQPRRDARARRARARERRRLQGGQGGAPPAGQGNSSGRQARRRGSGEALQAGPGRLRRAEKAEERKNGEARA